MHSTLNLRFVIAALCFCGFSTTTAAQDSLFGVPFVNATAWAIADAKTGDVLHGTNEEKALPMASTTKIMTAFLALRAVQEGKATLEELVQVSQFAGNTGGSSARLRPGDKLPLGELLYGLLLPSGNDAANAIAEHLGELFEPPPQPSSIPWNARSAGRSKAWMRFVAEMNRAARRLGLQETRYVNPHGLDAQHHHSSARDLLRLARAAMQFPEFRVRVATRSRLSSITTASGSRRAETWRNTNRLLGIKGFRGVKTGTTSNAGACLVANAVRGDDSLLIVVLNSSNRMGRYVDTRNLARWAFQQRVAGGK